MAQTCFDPALFAFLRALKRHNDRLWFDRNRERYEEDVRRPLLRFIADIAAPLQRVSAAVVADPRPVGGSMFRIHRDTRFSKDKTPYKTHAAAHFRHSAGRNVHAPGFYLHLEPGNVFFGAGIWHPDTEALAAIRGAIMDNSDLWVAWTRSRRFRSACTWEGEVVQRPPRGVPADHPLLDDLKHKDFTVLGASSEAEAGQPDFSRRFLRFCRAAAPLNEFLARALGLDW
jgi:uncharacterized protein (TIGR02453 family)